MQDTRFLEGVQSIIGMIFALGGVGNLVAAIVIMVIGIKKKKTAMVVVCIIFLLVSLFFSSIGIYLIYDAVRLR